MNEFCIFIADQKSENVKHTTKDDKQTLCKICRKSNEKREGNIFFQGKTSVKDENDIQT